MPTIVNFTASAILTLVRLSLVAVIVFENAMAYPIQVDYSCSSFYCNVFCFSLVFGSS